MIYPKDVVEHLSYILHDQSRICWFCRTLIPNELELFSCTGICSRNYHKSCLKYYINSFLSHNNQIIEDSINHDSTICFFCKHSYIGCTLCQKFTHLNNVIKCSIISCGNFYCSDLCISKIRFIYFTEDEITSYFEYMKLPLEVLEISKSNIICHSHFCYSCYDCDKYMYIWEKCWRRDLFNIRSRDYSLAWDFLRRTCKGSIESSYFNKGKCPTKPPRMPTLLRINLPNHNRIEILENLRKLNKLTQNTLYTCIRCDRSWCFQCYPPDASYINNCENSILCHDCYHQQIENEILSIPRQDKVTLHKNSDVSLNLHSNSQNIYRQLKSAIKPIKSHPGYINSSFIIKSDINKNKNNKLSSESEDHVRTNRMNIFDILPSNFIYIDSNYSTEENNKYLRIIDTPEYCNCEKSCDKNCINRSRAIEYYQTICKNTNSENSELKNNSNLKLYISKVDDKGYGVFASDYIYEGELLCEYTGEVITQDVYQNRLLSRCFRELDDDKQNHWYIMKIHKDVYVDSTKMGNISRYINHSCEPNCQSLPINYKGEIHMCIFSKRNINPNEEITYNYGFQSYGLFNGFSCVCGSKKCRGIIGNSSNDISLEKTLIRKLDGNTVDSLNDLIKDMHNLFTTGNNSSLKPRPIPIDVLNGIFTSEELEANERINNINSINKQLNISEKIKKLIINNKIDIKELLNLIKNLKAPLPLPMELKSNTHIEYLYTKLIALNGMSINNYFKAKTKKFAIDIPWSIIAFEYNQQKSLNVTSNPDFFVLAKRYFQCFTLLNVKHRMGKDALTNIHKFFDLSWGLTESCAACGGYGDCSVCDYCGSVLHNKTSCGDFISNGNNEIICSVCQHSNHRTKWYLKNTIEKEILGNKLYIRRLYRIFLNLIKYYENFITDDPSTRPDIPHTSCDANISHYVNYVINCNKLINKNDNFF